MDVFEAVAKRYSYRGRYQDVPVPREHLRQIVDAGIRAPSAKNEQVVSFVVADEPELIQRIMWILDRPVSVGAKAIIACIVDPRPVGSEGSYAVEDCAAAVENMLLAITALGYASVWYDGILRCGDKATRVGEALGVPRDLQVRVLLPVGVPVEPGAQEPRKPFEERAWFNAYGDDDVQEMIPS